MINVGA